MDTSLIRYLSTSICVIDQAYKLVESNEAWNKLHSGLFDEVKTKPHAHQELHNALNSAFTNTPGTPVFAIYVHPKGDSMFHFQLTRINKEPAQCLVEMVYQINQYHAHTLIQHANNLLSLVDDNYRYLAVNKRYSDVWGKKINEIEGQHVADILGADVFKSIVKGRLDKSLAGNKCEYTEWFYSESLNKMLLLNVVYEPVRKPHDNKVSSVAVTVTDVTEAQVDSPEVRKQAYNDQLTGLYNRYALTSRFASIKESLFSGEQYCVGFLDLNDFKALNDKHGHSIGDKFLKLFAGKLKDEFREKDFCCRWGGDEFVIIVPAHKTKNVTKELERRLQSISLHQYSVGDLTTRLAFSVGLANFPKDGESLDEILASADKHMYQNKRKSKSLD